MILRKTSLFSWLAASVAVGTALIFAPLSVQADEGQWLPEQLRGLDWAELKERGLELTANEIWDGEEGLLSAAINLNGCSASFVSEQGLVVTNHHCGFSAINRASTVEQNYLRDGFVAGEFGEEIPSPGMRVSYVTGYDDVTAEMHAAAAEAGNDPAAQYRAVQQRRSQLAREASGEFSEAIVVPYFEGRIWRRIHRTVLRDVRLVYAPPRMVGEYGGETDNWMWPRHTGDFTFFRAYVSPDGKPAGYSEDNVPYSPPRHLVVSEEGADEGELVMIMGYPGRTQRYLSSVAVAARQQFFYPARWELFSTMIAELEERAAQSEEAALSLASRIKSLSNVEKNARGMMFGLKRNKVVEKKEREEAEFQAWVDADDGRRSRYGSLLSDLFELDEAEARRMGKDFVLDNLSRYSGTFSRARRGLRNDEVDGGALLLTEDLPRDVLFRIARDLPEGERLAGFDTWDQNGGEDLVGLARALEAEYRAQRVFRDRQAGLRQQIGALWIEAQEKWRGRNFYPDANSTLRVSTATVKGYAPRDGVMHTPHTTVGGMLAKHTGAGDFDAPDEIFAAVDADPSALGIQVCFLADGDTTGGNSGSPVVDGKGRLVGLNFDRVFENVAGDFGWNEARSRNISVDIRYVLWLMREVWPAPHLLKEMGVATEHQQASAAGTPALRVRVGLLDGEEEAGGMTVNYLGREVRLGKEYRFPITGIGTSQVAGAPNWGLFIDFPEDGAFRDFTAAHTGRPMAVMVGDEALRMVMLQTAIPSRLNLRGTWNEAEANDAALRLMTQTSSARELADASAFATGNHVANAGRPTLEVRVDLQPGDSFYESAEVVEFGGSELQFGPTLSLEIEQVDVTKDALGHAALMLTVLDKKALAAWSEENVGRQIGLFVDRELVVVPVLNGTIRDGRVQLSGGSSGFSDEELDKLVQHFSQSR